MFIKMEFAFLLNGFVLFSLRNTFDKSVSYIVKFVITKQRLLLITTVI